MEDTNFSMIRDRKERRRARAKARQEAYSKLSQAERLARLVPGGSARQRARIAAGKDL